MKYAFTLFLLFASLTLSAQTFTLQPELTEPVTSAPQFLIPVAGVVPGAGGEIFRTDITLLNLVAHSQHIRFEWLPQGRSGLDEPPRILEMGAATGLSSADFVSDVLVRSGLGAILVTGIENDGDFDPTASLHATVRVWTPNPNGDGTLGQTFTAVPTDVIDGSLKWIFGVRRGDGFRLNAGIVNFSEVEQTFVIRTAPSSAPASGEIIPMTLPPKSMQQIPLTGTAGGTVQIVIENTSPVPNQLWTAYASSVDNDTGDAWSQIAFKAP